MSGSAAASPGRDSTDRVFAIVVALFLLYAALFIYRTSFIVGGVRYFSLFDDAMISMRYARNLARGGGLVWNRGGERVEGYTNLLWVLYMSVVHRLPLAEAKMSAVIQATAAVLLALNLWFVRRIALVVSGGSAAAAIGAVALTAFYLPINNWSLQGMEVAALLPLLSAAVWLAMEDVRQSRSRPSAYILLGVGTLIRPDMAVPLLALAVFLAVVDRDHRVEHVTWAAAALAAGVVAQTAFRAWYFGDVLPNTYYLKLTGVPAVLRWTRGAFVLLQFGWKFNLLLLAIAVLAGVRQWPGRMLLWIFAAQAAYSVYVGGDAWEYWGGSNRYIALAMPGMFVLLSDGLYRLAPALLDTAGVGHRASLAAARRLRIALFAALVAFAGAAMNSIYGTAALAELLLIKPPLHSGPGDENATEVEQALVLRRATTADATVAVVRAGTIPYFLDRFSIDLLGKTDRHIAREQARMPPGRRRFVEFRPGHVKFDYDYSIGRLQPDVIVQLWEHPDEASRYLSPGYAGIRVLGRCMYFRRASPHILWHQLAAPGCAS